MRPLSELDVIKALGYAGERQDVENVVPYGYCECGCGEKTRPAPNSNRGKGWVKGQPMRFVANHAHNKGKRGRALEIVEGGSPGYDVDTETGCWVWNGSRSKGYGKKLDPWTQRPRGAHVMSYEQHVGPVPEGLELDHLCCNKACVNPTHLEPVTHAENMRRAAIARASNNVTAVPRRSLARGNDGSPGAPSLPTPGLSRPATASERPDANEEGSDG